MSASAPNTESWLQEGFGAVFRPTGLVLNSALVSMELYYVASAGYLFTVFSSYVCSSGVFFNTVWCCRTLRVAFFLRSGESSQEDEGRRLDQQRRALGQARGSVLAITQGYGATLVAWSLV